MSIKYLSHQGQFHKTNFAILGSAILVCLLFVTSSQAQHIHCQKCGCSTKHETKMKLVRSYQKVLIPKYETSQESRFFQQKGMIEHYRHSNDSFVMRRDSRCGGDCLDCYTEDGCQRNVGAIPSGTHEKTCFREPVGVTVHYVPVFQWKKVGGCVQCGTEAVVVPDSPASISYSLSDETQHDSTNEKRSSGSESSRRAASKQNPDNKADD